MSIHQLFYPRGVAVVGSTKEGKIGYELLRQIIDGGFNQVFAVNPKAQGCLGVPGYSSVSEIESPIDLVIVASPAGSVPAVLEDAGKAGAKSSVIITSGFSEVGNCLGEVEIKQVAAKYGMRLVGPNCAGIINTHHCLYASLETRPPVGEVAFISQSGAIGGAALSWAEEQGLGFSKFVSYGNRADLDEIEILPYLAHDEETKVGALYIESVADGRAFMNAVREFSQFKPLVVIKSGRSRAGKRATFSHTGSMAGSDEVYESALRESGAIRVDTVEEMFDLCKGFVSLPRIAPKAIVPTNPWKPRLAIVTNSGGLAVMAADHAEELGLEVCEPSQELTGKLAEFLPTNCSLHNPFDLTVEGTGQDYRETLCAVLGEYDAAVALDVSTPYLDTLALARGVSEAAGRTSKPIAASFMAGRIVAQALSYLKAHGIPNYPSGERAVEVLARMAEYSRYRSKRRLEVEPSGPEKRLPCNGDLLEPEAMEWLAENGITTLPFRFAKSLPEAVCASRDLGYPVAMKVVSPDIIHKSDWGGVKLDIQDDQDAAEAFKAIRRAIGRKQPGEMGIQSVPDFPGVIIYPMVTGAQELLIGISNDRQFGPVVVFGMGGIFTEVWNDISIRVAPINNEQAAEMIREVRSFPILSGARGRAPCDLLAVEDTLVKVSELPFRYPEISEIDLNPVFAMAKGISVGDVRIIRKEKKGQ